MKTVPTSLQDRLGQLQQAPRYVYRFFHVRSLSEYAFSRDFATDAIASAVQTYLVAGDPPSGNTQTIVPEQGHSSIGTFILPLFDLGGEVTKQFASPGAGLTVTVSAESVLIPASLSGGLTAAYPPFGTIELASGGALERIRYFTLTDSQFGTATLPCSRGVDGTTALAHTAPSSVQNGEQVRKGTRAQIFVGDESVAFAQYMSVTKMQVQERAQREPGVYTVTLQDLQRELRRYAFLDAAPDTSSTTNTLTRQGNPLTLLLQVWTTTSGGGNGDYDQGDGRGAGIPAGLITVTSIEALRDSQFPNDVYRYLFRAPIEVKPWSEQLLKTLNCYPFITQSGTLGVKRIVASGSAVSSLTTDSILSPPRWTAGDPFIANQLTVMYDFGEEAATGQYATQEIFSSETSVAKYGRTSPFIIEGPGLRTTNSAAAVVLNRAERFFERYANPPPTLQVEAHYQHLDVDVGDTVSVTHPYVPDLRTGQLGLTGALFEVTDVRPIFAPAEGPPRVVFTLLHTGGADLLTAPTTGRISTSNPIDTTPGIPDAPGAVSSLHVASGQVGTAHVYPDAISGAATTYAEGVISVSTRTSLAEVTLTVSYGRVLLWASAVGEMSPGFTTTDALNMYIVKSNNVDFASEAILSRTYWGPGFDSALNGAQVPFALCGMDENPGYGSKTYMLAGSEVGDATKGYYYIRFIATNVKK